MIQYGTVRDLSDFGLKGRLPIFIDNFLSNRNSKVSVGTTLSDLQDQEEGVLQGSILSLCPKHTESVKFAPHKSPWARCA